MPAFSDPFYGNVPPKKLSLGELIRAIRLNIAAEEEAAAIYEAHADATDNPLARKVLLDIANEERVHVGEFVELLDILTKQEEKAWMQQGYDEVKELAEEVARGDLEPASPAEKAGEAASAESGEQVTIGSLKED